MKCVSSKQNKSYNQAQLLNNHSVKFEPNFKKRIFEENRWHFEIEKSLHEDIQDQIKEMDPFVNSEIPKQFFVSQTSIETDLRKPSPFPLSTPYCGSCKIELMYKNPMFKNRFDYATGAIIGKNLVLTVAHNLWKKEIIQNEHCMQQLVQELLTPSELFIDVEGQPELLSNKSKKHRLQVEQFIIHPLYRPSPKPQLTDKDPFDLAILILKQNDVITPEHCLQIDWGYSFENYKENMLNIIGYPNLTVDHQTQYFQSKKGKEFRSPYLSYLHFTSSGNSGSPVILELQNQKKSQYKLIGLHKTSRINFGFCVILNQTQNQRFLLTYLQPNINHFRLQLKNSAIKNKNCMNNLVIGKNTKEYTIALNYISQATYQQALKFNQDNFNILQKAKGNKTEFDQIIQDYYKDHEQLQFINQTSLDAMPKKYHKEQVYIYNQTQILKENNDQEKEKKNNNQNSKDQQIQKMVKLKKIIKLSRISREKAKYKINTNSKKEIFIEEQQEQQNDQLLNSTTQKIKLQSHQQNSQNKKPCRKILEKEPYHFLIIKRYFFHQIRKTLGRTRDPKFEMIKRQRFSLDSFTKMLRLTFMQQKWPDLFKIQKLTEFIAQVKFDLKDKEKDLQQCLKRLLIIQWIFFNSPQKIMAGGKWNKIFNQLFLTLQKLYCIRNIGIRQEKQLTEEFQSGNYQRAFQFIHEISITYSKDYQNFWDVKSVENQISVYQKAIDNLRQTMKINQAYNSQKFDFYDKFQQIMKDDILNNFTSIETSMHGNLRKNLFQVKKQQDNTFIKGSWRIQLFMKQYCFSQIEKILKKQNSNNEEFKRITKNQTFNQLSYTRMLRLQFMQNLWPYLLQQSQIRKFVQNFERNYCPQQNPELIIRGCTEKFQLLKWSFINSPHKIIYGESWESVLSCLFQKLKLLYVMKNITKKNKYKKIYWERIKSYEREIIFKHYPKGCLQQGYFSSIEGIQNEIKQYENAINSLRLRRTMSGSSIFSSYDEFQQIIRSEGFNEVFSIEELNQKTNSYLKYQIKLENEDFLINQPKNCLKLEPIQSVDLQSINSNNKDKESQYKNRADKYERLEMYGKSFFCEEMLKIVHKMANIDQTKDVQNKQYSKYFPNRQNDEQLKYDYQVFRNFERKRPTTLPDYGPIFNIKFMENEWPTILKRQNIIQYALSQRFLSHHLNKEYIKDIQAAFIENAGLFLWIFHNSPHKNLLNSTWRTVFNVLFINLKKLIIIASYENAKKISTKVSNSVSASKYIKSIRLSFFMCNEQTVKKDNEIDWLKNQMKQNRKLIQSVLEQMGKEKKQFIKEGKMYEALKALVFECDPMNLKFMESNILIKSINQVYQTLENNKPSIFIEEQIKEQE